MEPICSSTTFLTSEDLDAYEKEELLLEKLAAERYGKVAELTSFEVSRQILEPSGQTIRSPGQIYMDSTKFTDIDSVHDDDLEAIEALNADRYEKIQIRNQENSFSLAHGMPVDRAKEIEKESEMRPNEQSESAVTELSPQACDIASYGKIVIEPRTSPTLPLPLLDVNKTFQPPKKNIPFAPTVPQPLPSKAGSAHFPDAFSDLLSSQLPTSSDSSANQSSQPLSSAFPVMASSPPQVPGDLSVNPESFLPVFHRPKNAALLFTPARPLTSQGVGNSDKEHTSVPLISHFQESSPAVHQPDKILLNKESAQNATMTSSVDSSESSGFRKTHFNSKLMNLSLTPCRPLSSQTDSSLSTQLPIHSPGSGDDPLQDLSCKLSNSSSSPLMPTLLPHTRPKEIPLNSKSRLQEIPLMLTRAQPVSSQCNTSASSENTAVSLVPGISPTPHFLQSKADSGCADTCNAHLAFSSMDTLDSDSVSSQSLTELGEIQSNNVNHNSGDSFISASSGNVSALNEMGYKPNCLIGDRFPSPKCHFTITSSGEKAPVKDMYYQNVLTNSPESETKNVPIGNGNLLEGTDRMIYHKSPDYDLVTLTT